MFLRMNMFLICRKFCMAFIKNNENIKAYYDVGVNKNYICCRYYHIKICNHFTGLIPVLKIEKCKNPC